MLEEETLLDGQRLPTGSILAPLVAIWAAVPSGGDREGNARTLLRRYIWRSNFTDRYERSIQAVVLQDYRGLRSLILDGDRSAVIPCFDGKAYPLPGRDELMQAGWPKRRDTLARAILAVSLRGGAEDIADGASVSRANLPNREYHHLFPAAYLRDRGVPGDQASRALNCALVTWKSNRTVGAQEPLRYLRDRADANALGESEIRHRLATHAVSYDLLASDDYERFLAGRADVLLNAITDLCEGRSWVPPLE